jgi:hypothetical protein
MKDPVEALKHAFDEFYLEGDGVYQKEMEAFTQRWGSITFETMKRVLTEGHGDDVVIAIFALGFLQTPDTSTLLSPFLASLHVGERWASALCLGAIKDPQALPVLERLLFDGLASRDWFLVDQQNIWEDGLRGHAALLLGEWGLQQTIPLLRKALFFTWELEQRFFSHMQGRQWSASDVQAWYYYQDALTFALGQAGAFGALTTSSFPTVRLFFYMINFALGHLHAYNFHNPLEWAEDEVLKSKVAEILAYKFGLSEEEQQGAFDTYGSYYFERLQGNVEELDNDFFASLELINGDETDGQSDTPAM